MKCVYIYCVKHHITDHRKGLISCVIYVDCDAEQTRCLSHSYTHSNRVISVIFLRWLYITCTYLIAMAAVYITASGAARNKPGSTKKRFTNIAKMCFSWATNHIMHILPFLSNAMLFLVYFIPMLIVLCVQRVDVPLILISAVIDADEGWFCSVSAGV